MQPVAGHGNSTLHTYDEDLRTYMFSHEMTDNALRYHTAQVNSLQPIYPKYIYIKLTVELRISSPRWNKTANDLLRDRLNVMESR